MHNQKDNNKFKNKQQPELTENRTVWKSNNQGDKQETSIPTGRRGGDGQPSGEDRGKGGAGGQGRQEGSWWTQPGGGLWTGQSHIHMQINQEEQLGSKKTVQPRAPAQGNKASNRRLKTLVGVEVPVGETPSLIGEFSGETHRGLERAQAHSPGNQHQKGTICFWVVEEVTENWQSKQHCSLLDPSSTYSITMQPRGLPHPCEPKAPPLYITSTPRQKKWPK